jgi:excisionase family DNA binding protein
MPRSDVREILEEILGPPLLLTFDEVGHQLGQSRTTVYALVRAGRLPVVHIGRSARIPRAAVEAFVTELVAEVI